MTAPCVACEGSGVDANGVACGFCGGDGTVELEVDALEGQR